MTDKRYEPVNLFWWLVFALLIGLALGVRSVNASERYRCDDGSCNEIEAEAEANADARSESDASSESDSFASSDNALTVNHAKRAPTTFLYMQNQVEACGRTFGFSGSNTSGGWTFGIPIPRSWTPTCDLWKAAEEAQQNGFIFTSYMFQCSIKAVRKVLTADTCEKFEDKALIELGFLEAQEITGLWITSGEYDELTMVQVDKEEYEEQQEQVESRQTHQQHLIESQQQEIEEQDEEISDLQERQAKEAARRAAARAALEKEE